MNNSPEYSSPSCKTLPCQLALITGSIMLDRHIDCARIYNNEKEIGIALRKMIEEGVVKHEDLWIMFKLWNSDHAPDDVPMALDKILQDLQPDYVDLYLAAPCLLAPALLSPCLLANALPTSPST